MYLLIYSKSKSDKNNQKHDKARAQSNFQIKFDNWLRNNGVAE